MKKLLSGLFGSKRANVAGIDPAMVRSREQAEQLWRDGKLPKILMFPEALGGEDVPPNVVYVPHGIPEAQELIVGTLTRFLREGLIDKLTSIKAIALYLPKFT